MSKTDITLVSNSSNHPLAQPIQPNLNGNGPDWLCYLAGNGQNLKSLLSGHYASYLNRKIHTRSSDNFSAWLCPTGTECKCECECTTYRSSIAGLGIQTGLQAEIHALFGNITTKASAQFILVTSRATAHITKSLKAQGVFNDLPYSLLLASYRISSYKVSAITIFFFFLNLEI